MWVVERPTYSVIFRYLYSRLNLIVAKKSPVPVHPLHKSNPCLANNGEGDERENKHEKALFLQLQNATT